MGRFFLPVLVGLGLLCIALLSACASVEKYEATLDTWIGKSEKELIAGWGIPDRQYDLDGGTKLLAFTAGRSVFWPATPPTCQTRLVDSVTAMTDCFGGAPALTQTLRCETTFTLVDKKVTAWRHEGNDCRL